METITLNGIDYITKEQYVEQATKFFTEINELSNKNIQLTVDKQMIQKLEGEIGRLNDENKMLKRNTNTNLKEFQFSSDNTFGIGAVELKGDWFSCGISLELLENAITVFKALKKQAVTLFFADKETPLIMGELDMCEKKSIVKGVVIAPRIENE